MKNMSHLNNIFYEMSDFDSFPSFEFTLVIELRNLDFESHSDTLFFDKKGYDVIFEYVPWKNI